MMRAIALSATVLCAATILSCYFDLQRPVTFSLIFVVAILVYVLLVRGLRSLSRISEHVPYSLSFYGRAHIWAHIVPAVYIFSFCTGFKSISINLFFLPLFAFFFYSGRRLWMALLQLFGSKLYRFFAFGNTGLLSGIVVASLSDLLLSDRTSAFYFNQLLNFYFSVHFLLIGISILSLEQDVRFKFESRPCR